MAGKTHRDVSRVSRSAETNNKAQSQIKMDSGLRRNDEQKKPNQHHPHPTLPLKGRAKKKHKIKSARAKRAYKTSDA